MEHIEQGDCAQNSCCDDFDNVDFCDMYSSVSRNSSVDVAIFSIESQLLMMTTKMIREVYTSLLNMIVTLVVYRHHLLLIMMPTTTRSSWLNCALRDDEAVYWVSIGHYEAVAVGN